MKLTQNGGRSKRRRRAPVSGETRQSDKRETNVIEPGPVGNVGNAIGLRQMADEHYFSDSLGKWKTVRGMLVHYNSALQWTAIDAVVGITYILFCGNVRRTRSLSRFRCVEQSDGGHNAAVELYHSISRHHGTDSR